MDNLITETIPESYRPALEGKFQGNILEVEYSVGNYINQSRKLVTNQDIDLAYTGRGTVEGEEIIKKCNVYLPTGYDPNNIAVRYNVLYLLHGVGGDRYEWLSCDLKNILDNLIANGDIDPLIVVFPDGRSAIDWTDRSFTPKGTNMLGFYYFDYELRYDLIPFIEANYNTYANIKEASPAGMAYNRKHRAIAGLSMGGMQTLNLTLGGYRCDSEEYLGVTSRWGNGLDNNVTAPGMLDLFAYAGAFSNAPTSSDGKVLGASLASSSYKLDLLYINCGDADGIAYQAGFEAATEGLQKAAGDKLGHYYREVIKDGVHDFKVWDYGAYNFMKMIF